MSEMSIVWLVTLLTLQCARTAEEISDWTVARTLALTQLLLAELTVWDVILLTALNVRNAKRDMLQLPTDNVPKLLLSVLKLTLLTSLNVLDAPKDLKETEPPVLDAQPTPKYVNKAESSNAMRGSDSLKWMETSLANWGAINHATTVPTPLVLAAARDTVSLMESVLQTLIAIQAVLTVFWALSRMDPTVNSAPLLTVPVARMPAPVWPVFPDSSSRMAPALLVQQTVSNAEVLPSVMCASKDSLGPLSMKTNRLDKSNSQTLALPAAKDA